MEELKWLLKFADKLPYLSLFPEHTKYWWVLNGERDRRSRRGWYVKRAGGSLRSNFSSRIYFKLANILVWLIWMNFMGNIKARKTSNETDEVSKATL